ALERQLGQRVRGEREARRPRSIRPAASGSEQGVRAGGGGREGGLRLGATVERRKRRLQLVEQTRGGREVRGERKRTQAVPRREASGVVRQIGERRDCYLRVVVCQLRHAPGPQTKA